MNAASPNNDHPVSLTPALRRKLLSAFNQRCKSIADFLHQWSQQSDILGQPPTAADMQNILYSVTSGTFAYWIINGSCQLLLDSPYRDHSIKQVPIVLKQNLRNKFNAQFKVKGETAWGEFASAWCKQLDDCDPPRNQTIRSFLASEKRDSCEHWLIDGLCQLLFNCSFNKWLEEEENKGQKEQAENELSSHLYFSLPENVIRWVGRTELINQLNQRLQQDYRILSIVGITGIGKTALAMRLMLEPEAAQSDRKCYCVSLQRELSNFEVLARQLLGEQAVTKEALQKDLEVLVRAMIAKLHSFPCILILDMVEEILELDSNGGHQFIEPGFTKLLEQVVKAEQISSRIIITSQYQPPIIAEGRYFERLYIERLKGLQESEALELFETWDIRLATKTDLHKIKQIIHVYEGHPLALRVIAGEIREPPYNGDIQAYWYEYGDEIEEVEKFKNIPEDQSRWDKPRLDRYSINLTDLVKKRIERTFTRLYQSDHLACLMLCQGAVYRRAVERQAWLLMINEYPDEAQVLAFQTLQRRFLLEEECNNHKILYRLHSLIRRVALDYLPKIEKEVLPL